MLALAVGVYFTSAEFAKAVAVTLLVVLAIAAAWGARMTRRYVATEIAKITELSAALACDKGICGDILTPRGRRGALICDLNANHRGWHGCRIPGSSERTSWTHRGVSP